MQNWDEIIRYMRQHPELQSLDLSKSSGYRIESIPTEFISEVKVHPNLQSVNLTGQKVAKQEPGHWENAADYGY